MQKRVLLGILCLLIGITPAITFLIFGNAQYIVWFSNHTFIILGIGLLLNSRFLVFAELCLGLIPEAYWSIDFFSKLITGKFLFGSTAYMFNNGSFNLVHLYSLQHLLFVPVALLALYWLGGPVKKAWIGSIIHGGFLLIISRFFPAKYNLNCVFSSSFLPIHFSYYQIIWPIIILINIFLVYFVFMRFFQKRTLKNHI